MRFTLGIILIIGGLLAGVWAGVWWAFVGGIIQIVEWCQADVASAGELAWGIAKVVLATPIGGIAVCVAILPGFAVLASD